MSQQQNKKRSIKRTVVVFLTFIHMWENNDQCECRTVAARRTHSETRGSETRLTTRGRGCIIEDSTRSTRRRPIFSWPRVWDMTNQGINMYPHGPSYLRMDAQSITDAQCLPVYVRIPFVCLWILECDNRIMVVSRLIIGLDPTKNEHQTLGNDLIACQNL